MFELKIGIALLTAMVATSVPAAAAGRVCSPTVEWVALDPGGNMVVALSGMGIATLCNFNGTISTSRGSVSSETCKGWYAGFTTSRAQRLAVTMWYDFGSAAAPECNALGYDWTVPAAYPYLIAFY